PASALLPRTGRVRVPHAACGRAELGPPFVDVPASLAVRTRAQGLAAPGPVSLPIAPLSVAIAPVAATPVIIRPRTFPGPPVAVGALTIAGGPGLGLRPVAPEAPFAVPLTLPPRHVCTVAVV